MYGPRRIQRSTAPTPGDRQPVHHGVEVLVVAAAQPNVRPVGEEVHRVRHWGVVVTRGERRIHGAARVKRRGDGGDGFLSGAATGKRAEQSEFVASGYVWAPRRARNFKAMAGAVASAGGRSVAEPEHASCAPAGGAISQRVREIRSHTGTRSQRG